MPEPLKLTFRPGVNRETTDYANTGGGWDCNLARVRSGNWSSMGGWQPFTTVPMLGTPRSLFPWSTLDGSRYYASGTNRKYYIVRGNEPVDVTPVVRTVTLTNPFTTTNGSALVTVTDAGSNTAQGDFVTYAGAAAVGGVSAALLNQEHEIVAVIDDNHYQIQVAAVATSTATGGGAAVVAAYQLTAGLNVSTFGNGWGTGPWGSNGWGTHSNQTVPTDQLRLWTEDNYGEDLLFNARDNAIFYKDMSANVADRAVPLTSLAPDADIPFVARQVLVSDNDRHVMAFGCNGVGEEVQDRLLCRWSDAESLVDWVASPTNSAGSLRIDAGSEFLKAVETTTEILAFTDVSLHSFRYVGAPFIFGQTRIATNIQLIAPNAVTSNGAITAWMGNGHFQWYNGVVSELPCSIRTFVFGRLNTAQAGKIVAGVNRAFSEFIWLMPVDGSQENNFYVMANFEDPSNPVWYYGYFNTLGRTAWIDAWYDSFPMAAAPDGYLYFHDMGTTDVLAGQQAAELDSFFTSSVFELQNGDMFQLVSRTIPDVDFDGSTTETPGVRLQFAMRDYPGDEFVQGPDEPVTRSVSLPVSTYTRKIDKRFRCRSVQFTITSDGIGTAWSLGATRIYANPDGKR